MLFEEIKYQINEDGSIESSDVIGEKIIECDDVILAIGQDNAFPWIERDIGIEFDKWDCPVVDEVTMMCSLDGIFLVAMQHSVQRTLYGLWLMVTRLLYQFINIAKMKSYRIDFHQE